jgi:hypothetical protein|nr:MAG TPA: hypothetical protein [Caudoviricetes sp.]
METEDLIRKSKNLDKKLNEMFEAIEQQIKEFINAEPDLTYKEMDTILDRIRPWIRCYEQEVKTKLIEIIKTHLNKVMNEQKISSVNTGINTKEETMEIKNTIPDFSKFSNEELFKCLWNIKVQLPKYTWQDYIENIDKMFLSREVLYKRNIEFEIKVK